MQRIAVWNTAFLGDAVLTLPLIQSLYLRYPGATIDYYVRSGLEALFAPHPALAAVYGYDKRGGQRGAAGLLRIGKEIASRGYDLWVSTHESARSGFAALASRARVRVGYKSAALNRFFYTHAVDRCFSDLPEIERLLELLRPLGDGPLSDWPELALAPEEKEDAAAFFSRLEGPTLGLHPGSVWGTKRWPAAYFADIGIRALEQGAHVLLFAGPGEEDMAREVRRHMVKEGNRDRLHDFSGMLSLPRLAAYLGRLSCYLTNDSGPMHLAWCQGTPVTAVFGPTVRFLGFFPRGAGATVFEVDEPCRPCGMHGPQVCPLGHHRCMTEIHPETVWPDIQAKLWGTRESVKF